MKAISTLVKVQFRRALFASTSLKPFSRQTFSTTHSDEANMDLNNKNMTSKEFENHSNIINNNDMSSNDEINMNDKTLFNKFYGWLHTDIDDCDMVSPYCQQFMPSFHHSIENNENRDE